MAFATSLFCGIIDNKIKRGEIMISNNSEEIARNKLVLLYIIKHSPNEYTNISLTEFLLEKTYMNYFLIQQYLSELIDSELLELVGDGDDRKYAILPKGEETLEYFQNKIPESIKTELSDDFNLQLDANIVDTQILAEYYPKEKDDQYTVNLKLVENEDILFSLYLDVGSEKQAKFISDKWKSNPLSIYQNIINIFIED